jgi:hypothetical protein
VAVADGKLVFTAGAWVTPTGELVPVANELVAVTKNWLPLPTNWCLPPSWLWLDGKSFWDWTARLNARAHGPK